METMHYSHARARFAETMDRVCKNHRPVVITRQKGEAAVILSLEDFSSLEETAYLLRCPKNARRLLDAVSQLKKGRGRKKKIRL